MAGDAMTRASGAGAAARPRGWADAGLSIVVPLFNEANNLATLHARILEVARALKAGRGLAPGAGSGDERRRGAPPARPRGRSAVKLRIPGLSPSRNFRKGAA